MALSYISLCRVSTEKQHDNTSLDYQDESNRLLGQNRNWNHYASYFDVVSGAKVKREGLEQALEALKEGNAHIIVVFDAFRFARSEIVSDTILRRIYDYGGKIAISMLGSVYHSYEEADEGLHHLISYASYERKVIRRRTSTGKLQRFKQGSFIFKAPFGYTQSAPIKGIKHLELDTTKAQIVQKVCEWLADGVSKNECARRVNNWKIYQYSFYPKAVNEIVKNVDLYAGGERRYKFKSEYQTYTFPKIISQKLAEDVKKIATIKSRNYEKDIPFKGIAKCICGADMVVRQSMVKNGRRLYYLCCVQKAVRDNYERTNIPTDHLNQCQGKLSALKIRNQVISHVEDDPLDIELVLEDAQMKKVVCVSKIHKLQNDLQDLHKQQSELTTRIMKVLDLDVFEDILSQLQEEQTALNEKREELQKEIDDIKNYHRVMCEVVEFIDNTKNLQDKVDEVENIAKEALANEDWKTANECLYSLGLEIEVDNGEVWVSRGAWIRDLDEEQPLLMLGEGYEKNNRISPCRQALFG